MKSFPVNPAGEGRPEALRAFLEQCRAEAARVGRPQLVSISLAVDQLDPLAVLESIFEPAELHFYAERPACGMAVAGAEAVLEFTTHGPRRFADAKTFILQTLSETIAVGAVDVPLGGPNFFIAAAFFDDPGAAEPFPALRVFVPRWQVARGESSSVAVANLLVTPETPVDLLATKVWKAHEKFRAFDYRSAAGLGRPSTIVRDEELGGAGGYIRTVNRALGEIRRGDYRKVVLARARRFVADEAFHPLGVLNHLRQRFPDCYAFSVANGRGQSFIGASPERLMAVEQGRLFTEALAGTAPRGRTASEDAALGRALLQSEKDLREQFLVLESIQRRLADLKLELEYPPGPRLRILSNLQHLQTPIAAALPAGVHVLDLVERLHPTPAVGGTPRSPACAALRRLEPFSRGLYAGPLGWVNHRGGGEFFVGLRSALIDGATATAYAGAGIVAGSEASAELAETELKFDALLNALVG
ncbi:MAG: isochorismate synthase [Opitutaceae bacterium]|nr:isochorismate synthase [Opitutaceae bacterium]